MRDIFTDLFEGGLANPMEAARRGMRPKLRARFYRDVTVAEDPGGFALRLDGKPVRTPARQILTAPARAIADAIAAEWAAQIDVIDPARMPLTRLANVVIDTVTAAPGPVAKEIEDYLGTDLTFYRAGDPDGLVANQIRHWDPLIAWAADVLGARFALAHGVMHVAQPEAALAAASRAIPRGTDTTSLWRLGAMNSATTLTGSAVIALALAAGRIDPEVAWQAANVDEDWNMAAWGNDELVLERRGHRRKELNAAALVLEHLR